MVRDRALLRLAFALAIFLLAGSTFAVFVQAQNIQYRVNHEWVKIWINQNGTIDLFYDMEIACTQGTISFVRIGQPNGDYAIGEARDQQGHSLTASPDDDGDNYRIRVNLYTPISAGEAVRFTLLTNVGRMIWEDEENPGNVGMQFIPTWWADALVNNLRLAVVLPEGVATEQVRNFPDWDNAFQDPQEDNRLVLYWERTNLQPNQRFESGVSFPKEFVEHYETREEGLDWLTIGVLLVAGGVFVVIVLAVLRSRKPGYISPVLRMETLGVRRGLTAVEASHILGLPPAKIVAEVLFSLLMKRAIWVEATDPVLKINAVKPIEGGTGETGNPLRYYEISFLKALKEDGTLDEVRLAKTLVLLRDTAEAKLHGYCREDTVTYYRSIVAKAWKQVERAGTPDLASKAYDENLLWLLLDRNLQSETGRIFKDQDFTPGPNWWWYWYIYTHTLPRPGAGTGPPTGDAKPPTIPGADFADKIVTSIEKTTNNFVVNVEKFANSILPPPPPPKKVSSKPARRGASCVCACAACACACACVSCACACASGGVG